MYLRRDFDPTNLACFSSSVRPKTTSAAWYSEKDPLGHLGERPAKEIIFEDSKEIHYKLEDGTTLKVRKKVRRTKKNTPDLYGINAAAIKSNNTNKKIKKDVKRSISTNNSSYYNKSKETTQVS